VTGTLVSLEEYLNTSYEPDMDFVDGVLVRRNAGTKQHATLQSIVAGYFRDLRHTHRVIALTEARMLVDPASGRHRIPDVLVLKIPFQRGRVVTEVPLVVVEIQSPDDNFEDMVERCFDYEKHGAGTILIMDPDKRRSWIFEQGTLRLLGDQIRVNLGGSVAELSFAGMFAELDLYQA